VGEVRAVSDMHQRKAEMARQADAFIALPGLSNFYICTHTCGGYITRICVALLTYHVSNHYHLIQFNFFAFTSIIIVIKH
jgi:hypothetical protein